MTGILDLMHALSDAWKAAKALEETSAYERYAIWIWQGKVQQVIDELKGRSSPSGTPGELADEDPVQRAITY